MTLSVLYSNKLRRWAPVAIVLLLATHITACTTRRAAPPPPVGGAPPPGAQGPRQPGASWSPQVPPLLTPQGWGIPLPSPVPQGAASWSQSEWDVLQRVNGYRARGFFCGGQFFPPTHPLRANPNLQSAARAHSWDMGRRNYFDHQSPDGHGPSDRARAAGFPGGSAENIHAGSAFAHNAVDAWMRSAGHCRNFMDGSHRELGIGHAHIPGSRYGHYWTANMGSR